MQFTDSVPDLCGRPTREPSPLNEATRHLSTPRPFAL